MSGSDNKTGFFESLISLSKDINDKISEPTEHIGLEMLSKINTFFVFKIDFFIFLKSRGLIDNKSK